MVIYECLNYSTFYLIWIRYQCSDNYFDGLMNMRDYYWYDIQVDSGILILCKYERDLR
jgi:hypothetical protein